MPTSSNGNCDIEMYRLEPSSSSSATNETESSASSMQHAIIQQMVFSRPTYTMVKNRRSSTHCSSVPDIDVIPTTAEEHAGKIVREIEQDELLMQNDPQSIKMRLDTVRDMPQTLTMKRLIKTRLARSVYQRAHSRKPIGTLKRLRCNLSMLIVKMRIFMKDLLNSLELWYATVKRIEGNFGSGVTVYFKFLRWLFLMNVFVSLFTFLFLILPRMVQIGPQTSTCPFLLANVLSGKGFLMNSTLYYGHYMDAHNATSNIPQQGYSIASAYFFIMLSVYSCSFMVLSFTMAKSYKRNFVESSGGFKSFYAGKIFCGWDFSIATKKAAALKSRAVFRELQEIFRGEDDEEVETDCLKTLINVSIKVFANFIVAIVWLTTGFTIWAALTYLNRFEKTYESDESEALHIDANKHHIIFAATVACIINLFPIASNRILEIENYKSIRLSLFIGITRAFLLIAIVIGVIIAFWLVNVTDKDCWESYFGREIYCLILLDFFIATLPNFFTEFVQFALYRCTKKSVPRPIFDVPRNVLLIIYNQILFWSGFFFSPMLCIVITIKFLLIWYIQRTSVLYFCKPLSRSWRAVHSQTVFLVLTFVSLLCIVITLGYIFTTVRSSDCGPFQRYDFMYLMVLNEVLLLRRDSLMFRILRHGTKPGVVAGILVTMCIRAYYLRAQAQAYSKMVVILRRMLQLESRDKEFLLKNISRATDGHWLYDFKHGKDESFKNRFRSPRARNVILNDSSSDENTPLRAAFNGTSERFSDSEDDAKND